MKTYQYQLLRYTDDHVTGEFVNVGLVFYEPETRLLCARVITDTERLASFFPDVPTALLLADLQYFAQIVNERGSRTAEHDALHPAQMLDAITAALIAPNDGALQLTQLERGLTNAPTDTFASLFQRLVRR